LLIAKGRGPSSLFAAQGWDRAGHASLSTPQPSWRSRSQTAFVDNGAEEEIAMMIAGAWQRLKYGRDRQRFRGSSGGLRHRHPGGDRAGTRLSRLTRFYDLLAGSPDAHWFGDWKLESFLLIRYRPRYPVCV
jgi:hypothetical protein